MEGNGGAKEAEKFQQSLDSVLDQLLPIGGTDQQQSDQDQGDQFRWCWDAKSAQKLAREETVRFEEGARCVQFHPLFAYGTAAVWGQCALTAWVRAYWEITVDDVYGSSMMFGIGTRNALQSVPCGFVDLIGGVGRHADEAYGLSHKGTIFHANEPRPYCEKFCSGGNGPCTVGVLFDGPSARMGFSLDGKWAGWAFQSMNLQDRVYHPMVSSTAQRSRFRLLPEIQRQQRSPCPLQGICMDAIVGRMMTKRGNEVPRLGTLGLPKGMECELWRLWCAWVMDNGGNGRSSSPVNASTQTTEGETSGSGSSSASVSTRFASSRKRKLRQQEMDTQHWHIRPPKMLRQ